MADRSIEDRLREEYFDLVPDIRRVAQQLEAETKYHTLPISRTLERHEQLQVTSRIKECDSAVDALRRRQESGTFDQNQPDLYSLLTLRDLAGVRVLVFPPKRLADVDQVLRAQFPAWIPDPFPQANILGHKYYGFCAECSDKIQGEYQVLSMLTGLFWEVEHEAFYKPTPRLKGIERHPDMKQRNDEVYVALRTWEDQFEHLALQGEDSSDESA